MVVVDTNVIIDHLRMRRKGESALVRLKKVRTDEKTAISLLTIQELYEGKSISNIDREKEMRSVLIDFEVLPYGVEIAKKAGEINRGFVHPRDAFDMAVAATCLINQYPLATLNKKDFVGIEGLELLKW